MSFSLYFDVWFWKTCCTIDCLDFQINFAYRTKDFEQNSVQMTLQCSVRNASWGPIGRSIIREEISERIERIVACRKEETEEIRGRGKERRGKKDGVVREARGTRAQILLSLSFSRCFLSLLSLSRRVRPQVEPFDLLFATRAIISRGSHRSSPFPVSDGFQPSPFPFVRWLKFSLFSERVQRHHESPRSRRNRLSSTRVHTYVRGIGDRLARARSS